MFAKGFRFSKKAPGLQPLTKAAGAREKHEKANGEKDKRRTSKKHP